MKNTIQSHLNRIKVSNSIVFNMSPSEKYIIIADDTRDWNGTTEEALNRLEGLNIGAGIESFWNVFNEYKMYTQEELDNLITA